MAGSVNKVILVGNLGADPEIRRTQDGRPIANLRLATSESWKDKTTGERKEKTEWHRVVIFNENLCRIAEQYLKKGSKVFIEGALQTRKWQDQSGQDKYSTEVVLQGFRGEMTLLDSRGSGGGSSGGGGGGDYGNDDTGDFGSPGPDPQSRGSGRSAQRRWRRYGRRDSVLAAFSLPLVGRDASAASKGGGREVSRGGEENSAHRTHLGYRILRFWNNDVLRNIDGVLEVIQNSISGTPTPDPSPQGGGER